MNDSTFIKRSLKYRDVVVQNLADILGIDPPVFPTRNRRGPIFVQSESWRILSEWIEEYEDIPYTDMLDLASDESYDADFNVLGDSDEDEEPDQDEMDQESEDSESQDEELEYLDTMPDIETMTRAQLMEVANALNLEVVESGPNHYSTKADFEAAIKAYYGVE